MVERAAISAGVNGRAADGRLMDSLLYLLRQAVVAKNSPSTRLWWRCSDIVSRASCGMFAAHISLSLHPLGGSRCTFAASRSGLKPAGAWRARRTAPARCAVKRRRRRLAGSSRADDDLCSIFWQRTSYPAYVFICGINALFSCISMSIGVWRDGEIFAAAQNGRAATGAAWAPRYI